jgi:nucleoid-associated protein YgaU
VIAKKGDTLSKLAVDVYGRVDERILMTLQKNNPSISNIHWIAIGQEIYFPPDRPQEEGTR